MKCRICDNFFYSETSFEDIFRFPSICEKCSLKYTINHYEETLPISNGTVTSHYIYNDIRMNAKQKDELKSNLESIWIKMIEKHDNKAIYLFMDDYLYETFESWFPFLKPFNNIHFMSLLRYDFDGFMNFF